MPRPGNGGETRGAGPTHHGVALHPRADLVHFAFDDTGEDGGVGALTEEVDLAWGQGGEGARGAGSWEEQG